MIICENIPRYGVVIVVVAIIETKFLSEIEKFGVEISDMFLKKFITVWTNVQIILKRQLSFKLNIIYWIWFNLNNIFVNRLWFI